jgi:ribosomal protein L11 methyltransferase
MNGPQSAGVLRYSLSLSLPLARAEQLASRIEDSFWEAAPAVSLREERPGGPDWRLDAYFDVAPDRPALEQLISEIAPGVTLDLELVPPADWVSIVQRELSPVAAGRFFIYGSHDRARATGRPGEIEIDAGQAFGTAHHGTTRGCLLALDTLFKRRRFRRILDLGTGTGLLAIAAARSLKCRVLASDIDPVSVRVARENAALNEAGPLTEVVVADGLSHPRLRKGAPYDLLIANILAAPLMQLAPAVAAATRRGSCLVLSGLLREQSPAVEARYRSFGFVQNQRLPLDEWMTLVLVRR